LKHWAKGKGISDLGKIKIHVIIDILQNAEKYFLLHPLFAKAFKFIKFVNSKELQIGKYEIEDVNLLALVSNKRGFPVRDSENKMECHNQYMDIQLCLNGKEKIGWKSRHTCTSGNEKYDQEKDVLFFNDKPDMYFELRKNQFAVFFPDDIHKPMIGKGNIKNWLLKEGSDFRSQEHQAGLST
jgi:biofilm protein TabA